MIVMEKNMVLEIDFAELEKLSAVGGSDVMR